MYFFELADYFEQLEATSSRLSLIDILSQVFADVDAREVPLVSYLLQGRIAPFYEPTEIGMAEKSVAAAIARIAGNDKDDVLKLYAKAGDLGTVAQDLIKSKTSRLTVQEVFEQLQKISQFKGEGTIENKISTLANLLKSVSGVEAKHLVRVPLGQSRLGIGDPTILDAFAQLKLGDKSKRKLLEGAYNKVSDLGLIGQTLWKDGLSGVEKLDVIVGRPIRSQLCERITDPQSILDKFSGKVHIQEKYDGMRVQIHKQGKNVRFFSRNLEETTDMYPDLVKAVLSQITADSVILDSEAIAFNPTSEEFLPFQETSKRRRKHGVDEAAAEIPLKAFVFDIMYLNGKSTVDTPLVERMNLLNKVIAEDDILIKNTGRVVETADDVQLYFNDALTKGLEGLILKRVDSLYEAGARNFNWVKMKKHSSGELKDTIDCVLLGYIFGRGKRVEFGAGALLVGIYDADKDEFVTVAKIGTGLTDDEWREIHARADKIKVDHRPPRVQSLIEPSVWVRPEIVVEILADEITKSPIHTAGKTEEDPGYALRFPRLVRFREGDKKAEDATTVKEIKEMYSIQYKKG